MMDDYESVRAIAAHAARRGRRRRSPGRRPDRRTPQTAGAPLAAAPTPSPAVEKFKSCRWRATPDDGEFCTHRDVLPFAGKEGFKRRSWCPECAFYKLRRTPKKRERSDYCYVDVAESEVAMADAQRRSGTLPDAVD